MEGLQVFLVLDLVLEDLERHVVGCRVDIGLLRKAWLRVKRVPSHAHHRRVDEP